MAVNRAFSKLQFSAASVLLNIPSPVTTYNLFEFWGFIARPAMKGTHPSNSGSSPEFIGFQLAPASVLLKSPTPPPAYTVLGSRGSIANIRAVTHSSQYARDSGASGDAFHVAPPSNVLKTALLRPPA